jgi:hypothetical protein
MKREHSAWGYERATLFLGYINAGTWFSTFGVRSRTPNLAPQKFLATKFKEFKIGSNLTEYSNEGFD